MSAVYEPEYSLTLKSTFDTQDVSTEEVCGATYRCKDKAGSLVWERDDAPAEGVGVEGGGEAAATGCRRDVLWAMAKARGGCNLRHAPAACVQHEEPCLRTAGGDLRCVLGKDVAPASNDGLPNWIEGDMACDAERPGPGTHEPASHKETFGDMTFWNFRTLPKQRMMGVQSTPYSSLSADNPNFDALFPDPPPFAATSTFLTNTGGIGRDVDRSVHVTPPGAEKFFYDTGGAGREVIRGVQAPRSSSENVSSGGGDSSGDNGNGDNGSGDNGSGDNGSGDNGSGDNGSGDNGSSGGGGGTVMTPASEKPFAAFVIPECWNLNAKMKKKAHITCETDHDCGGSFDTNSELCQNNRCTNQPRRKPAAKIYDGTKDVQFELVKMNGQSSILVDGEMVEASVCSGVSCPTAQHSTTNRFLTVAKGSRVNNSLTLEFDDDTKFPRESQTFTVENVIKVQAADDECSTYYKLVCSASAAHCPESMCQRPDPDDNESGKCLPGPMQ